MRDGSEGHSACGAASDLGERSDVGVRVLNCMLDNRFGGPHRRSEAVAQRLREDGIETVFLLCEKADGLVPIEAFECVLVRHMQVLRRGPALGLVEFLTHLPATLRRLRDVVKDHRIQIVHVNGLLNIVPALAARSAGLPVIWHLNDTHTPAMLRRVLLALAGRLSDRIIVQGEAAGRRCLGRRAELWKKTAIIYAGVDTQRFDRRRVGADTRRRVRAELGADDGCILVGTVANLNPCKGHTYFIEAAHKVKKRFGRVRFVIVGSALDTHRGYAERLARLTARLDMQDEVIFAGFRSRVEDVLAALDVFVLASIAESCPNAVLEAMSMEAPVVVTDVGSVCELVSDGGEGFVVRAGDVSAMADAIGRVIQLSPEDRARMGACGRRRAEGQFGAGGVAEQHRRIYEAVLRDRSGRGAAGSSEGAGAYG